MRFLIDQCLSAELAESLRATGHDAVHVSSYGLSRADDDQILARAAAETRVLVSADTDFGGLLASRDSSVPSVVLFRRRTRRRPHEQAAILLANLAAIEEDLDAGDSCYRRPRRAHPQAANRRDLSDNVAQH